MKKKALLALFSTLLALSLAATPALAAAAPPLTYGAFGEGVGYVITPGTIYYGTHYGDLHLWINAYGFGDVWLEVFSGGVFLQSFEWIVVNWHYAGNLLIMNAVPSGVYGYGPCPIIITIQLNSPYHAIVLGLKVLFTGNIVSTWSVSG